MVEAYLEQIQEQMSTLTAISRSSLSFYKGQTFPQKIGVTHIAKSAIKLHHGRLRGSAIHLDASHAGEAMSFGIASEILQVFSNLILNAADALTETQQPRISIRTRRTVRWNHFIIADNGPGIPEHVQARLFQAHATGKDSGMGMGLWLSRHIITKHGGHIRFKTCREPARCGTVLSVTLPIHASAD